MKNNIINKLLPLLLLLPAVFITSCTEETPGKYEMTDGLPTVYYVRYQNKDLEEQLLAGAQMNENIVLIGDNLTSIQEVWFNNVKAVLNINFITKNTLFVNVPNDLPSVLTNKIYLVTGKKDTVAYDFEVRIPAPKFTKMKCEQVPEGGEVVVEGDYFLATDPSLIRVFVGDYEIPTSDIVSFEKTKLVFKAPAVDIRGQIEIRTVYGRSGRSKDVFHDDRGLLTGFEEGFVGGWGRPSAARIQNDPALALTGNYCRLDGKQIDPGPWSSGGEDNYTINFWGEDNGVPTGNFFSSDPATSTLKFEVNVLEPWTALPMIICFFKQGGLQDYLWADGTSAGGGQPRAIWAPWKGSGSYVSDGWETVSIPLADFKYNGYGVEVPLTTAYGALGLSIHNRGSEYYAGEAACNPVILIDNIRVIP
ncbi:MAG: glycan-binding surface protein [Dysgonamonadaceae bacterium]|jgi:hypothetical protein|nr:glycan-binding surface protein [Dysgonamonadaceae bacterium]